jgi:hypothetical protein
MELAGSYAHCNMFYFIYFALIIHVCVEIIIIIYFRKTIMCLKIVNYAVCINS